MTQQETATPSVPSKKQVRKQIVEKLTGALADYKESLGEKKLASYVKKASKLISRDLRKANKKHEEGTKVKSKKEPVIKANKKAGKKAAQKAVKK